MEDVCVAFLQQKGSARDPGECEVWFERRKP
jgi:hypothetical protein